MKKTSSLISVLVSFSAIITSLAQVIDFSGVTRDLPNGEVRVINIDGPEFASDIFVDDNLQVYHIRRLDGVYGDSQGKISVNGSVVTLGADDQDYNYEQVAVPVPYKYLDENLSEGSLGYAVTTKTIVSFELREEGVDEVGNKRIYSYFSVAGRDQLLSLNSSDSLVKRILIGDNNTSNITASPTWLVPGDYGAKGDPDPRVIKSESATDGWVRYTVYLENYFNALPPARTGHLTHFLLGHYALGTASRNTPTKTHFRNFRIYEEGPGGPVVEAPQLKVREDAIVDGDVYVAGAVRGSDPRPLVLSGTVVLEKPQGDIKTGIYNVATPSE